MKLLKYFVIFIFILFSETAFGQINMIWGTSGSGIDLYNYADGKVKYYCSKGTSSLTIFNAEDLQLAYTLTIDPDDFPYQLIPDMNSNGHDEILFQGTNSNGDDIVKIVDMGTQDMIYLWEEPGADYYFQNMHQPVNSNELRVHIFKYLNGSLAESSVYSLGISTSGSRELPGEIPDNGFRVNQNYPNPFNGSTLISYKIYSPGEVKLRIFNVNGELIKEYSQTKGSKGTYYVHWDGTNNNGERAASGTYLYSVENQGKMTAKKMILLK